MKSISLTNRESQSSRTAEKLSEQRSKRKENLIIKNCSQKDFKPWNINTKE